MELKLITGFFFLEGFAATKLISSSRNSQTECSEEQEQEEQKILVFWLQMVDKLTIDSEILKKKNSIVLVLFPYRPCVVFAFSLHCS